MSFYTNKGLVEHAKMALALKTKYMNSGILRPITTRYLNDTISRVEKAGCSASATGYTEARKKYMREQIADKGFYGVDCVCLIKSYYWSGKANGGVGSPKYVGSNDVNAGVMFRKATVKGPISTLPEIPGLIVYSRNPVHVGIYIGGGYTIESTLGSRGDGVVKRKLDSLWTDWFQCPYIDYEIEDKPVSGSSTGATSFKIGEKIKIKSSATVYADSTIRIPALVKEKVYTINKISGNKARLKEIFSWVRLSDIEKIS